MRIALITCGESAKTSWSDAKGKEYDYVVAVNWASHLFSSDWVVAFDDSTWRYGKVIIPRIGGVSYRRLSDHVNSIRLANDLEWELVEELMECGKFGKCSFTFPNALRFCFEEWPDASVDIYGLDMNKNQGLCMWDNGHSSNRLIREVTFVEAIIHEHWNCIKLIGCEFTPRTPRVTG